MSASLSVCLSVPLSLSPVLCLSFCVFLSPFCVSLSSSSISFLSLLPLSPLCLCLSQSFLPFLSVGVRLPLSLCVCPSAFTCLFVSIIGLYACIRLNIITFLFSSKSS